MNITKSISRSHVMIAASVAVVALSVMLIPDVASAAGGLKDTMTKTKTLMDTVKSFMFTMAQIVGAIAFLFSLFLWKKRIDAGEQGASQHPWGKILATAGFGIALFMAGTLFDQTTQDITGGSANANATYQFK